MLLYSVYAIDQVLIIGLEKHAENQNYDIEVINTSSSGNTTQDDINY